MSSLVIDVSKYPVEKQTDTQKRRWNRTPASAAGVGNDGNLISHWSQPETLSSPTTVKPSNLAATKIGDFTCKIILAPFILAN